MHIALHGINNSLFHLVIKRNELHFYFQELYSGSRGHLQFKDEFLIREERGKKIIFTLIFKGFRICVSALYLPENQTVDLVLFDYVLGSKCTYGGEEYVKGTTLDIPVEPNYERCDRCKCIRGKFRKCTTISYCHLQCDEIEFLPDQCCPVCKRKSEFSSHC